MTWCAPRSSGAEPSARPEILGLAAVYYAAGRIGLLEQVVVEGAVVTPLWPPTGIALRLPALPGPADLARDRARDAAGHLRRSARSPSAACGIVLGNTLAPLCSFLLLRAVGFRMELDRLRDGLALVFLGAFGGMLISATVGSRDAAAQRKLPASGFWPVWCGLVGGRRDGRTGGHAAAARPAQGPAGRGRTYRSVGRGAALLVAAVVVALVATRSPLPCCSSSSR